MQGRYARLIGLGACLLTASLASGQTVGRPLVLITTVDDAIHPITAEYISASLETANEIEADLFLLQLSTPGGLDTSMRDIIQAMLNSPVPVCVFVGPSGARAASAGFLIALAADVVAMAPGTNTGAASPVPVGGGSMDETMAKKVNQDAMAYARSLAEGQGRPVDAAVEAVSDGRSFAANEALDLGLVDFIAVDTDEVLRKLEGHVIEKLGREPITLALQDAVVVDRQMSLRQRLLSILANPQVAYILLLVGLGGLYFEISTPGAILPGVIGGMCLVLALLAFQVLPISYAGLALLGLAILFFIVEVKVTSYGLLSVAGLISFVLGSLMLVPGPIPEMRLQLSFVLPSALAMAGLVAGLVWMVVTTHKGRVVTGSLGLVSEIGRATTALGPGDVGAVFVHGELWRARSEQPVERGQSVRILAVERGMRLLVRPHLSEKGA